MTNIEVGDRVRLTARREPTVTLEGDVTDAMSRFVAVKLAPGTRSNSFSPDEWRIEKILPPTIVRVRALGIGAVFDRGPNLVPVVKLAADDWRMSGNFNRVFDSSVAEELDTKRESDTYPRIAHEGVILGY